MTLFIMSCSQYTTEEDGTTTDVSTFLINLQYERPTDVKVALEDFRKVHAQSHYSTDGWSLVGSISYFVIKTELYESYEMFIDDGIIEVKQPKPANSVPRLRLV
jgi:hypothetical protein